MQLFQKSYILDQNLNKMNEKYAKNNVRWYVISNQGHLE